MSLDDEDGDHFDADECGGPGDDHDGDHAIITTITTTAGRMVVRKQWSSRKFDKKCNYLDTISTTP